MRKRRSVNADDSMSVTIVEMTVDTDHGEGAGSPMPGFYIKLEVPGLEPGRIVLLGPFTTIEAAVDEAIACSAEADLLGAQQIPRALH